MVEGISGEFKKALNFLIDISFYGYREKVRLGQNGYIGKSPVFVKTHKPTLLQFVQISVFNKSLCAIIKQEEWFSPLKGQFSKAVFCDLPPLFVPSVMLVRQARGQGRQARVPQARAGGSPGSCAGAGRSGRRWRRAQPQWGQVPSRTTPGQDLSGQGRFITFRQRKPLELRPERPGQPAPSHRRREWRWNYL